MALDENTVRNIAFLARIEVAEDALAPLASELDHILGWIEQLAEVDTADVEPMTSVVRMALPLRPDEISGGDIEDKVLSNAPEARNGFFLVPKVIE